MGAGLLPELAQLAILVGDGHALEVAVVANGLEVTANEEKVDFVVVALFEIDDLGVNGVELAVAAAFNGNLAWRLRMGHEANRRKY